MSSGSCLGVCIDLGGSLAVFQGFQNLSLEYG